MLWDFRDEYSISTGRDLRKWHLREYCEPRKIRKACSGNDGCPGLTVIQGFVKENKTEDKSGKCCKGHILNDLDVPPSSWY